MLINKLKASAVILLALGVMGAATAIGVRSRPADEGQAGQANGPASDSSSPSKDPAKPTGRICATVNGATILDEEVATAAAPALQKTKDLPEPERARRYQHIWKETLERMIERELVLQDAFSKSQGMDKAARDKLQQAAAADFEQWMKTVKRRANLRTDEELKEFMRARGTPLDAFRLHWIREFMSREHLRNRVEPSLAAVTPPDPAETPEQRRLREEQRTEAIQRATRRLIAELKSKAIIEYAGEQRRQN